jgi:hypothetical protein
MRLGYIVAGVRELFALPVKPDFVSGGPARFSAGLSRMVVLPGVAAGHCVFD